MDFAVYLEFFVDGFFSDFDAFGSTLSIGVGAGNSRNRISPLVKVSVSCNDAVIPESFAASIGLSFNDGYFSHEFLVKYSFDEV